MALGRHLFRRQGLFPDHHLIRIQLLLHLHRIPSFILWLRAQPPLPDAIEHNIGEHDKNEKNTHQDASRLVAAAIRARPHSTGFSITVMAGGKRLMAAAASDSKRRVSASTSCQPPPVA